jgi:hypothetical protein
MSVRIIRAVPLFIAILILSPALYAADNSTPSDANQSKFIHPSVSLAKQFQKLHDNVAAIMVYDAILEKHPKDKQILNRMVRCHELMLQRELSEAIEESQPSTKVADDGLPDLPQLVPTQDTNWRHLLPSSTLHLSQPNANLRI